MRTFVKGDLQGQFLSTLMLERDGCGKIKWTQNGE